MVELQCSRDVRWYIFIYEHFYLFICLNEKMEGIYEKEKELSERISKKQPRFVPFAVIVGCGLLYLHS